MAELDRYTELFLEEAGEQIEELNQNLLVLEREGAHPEVINEIFRTAHTLKSSAAFVGLDALSEAAHYMEDVLQNIKDGQVEVSTHLVNIFFQLLDRIKRVITIVSEGEKSDEQFSDLIEELKKISRAAGGSSTPAGAPAAGASGSAPATGSGDSGGTAGDGETIEISDLRIKLSPEEENELWRLAEKQTIFDGLVTLDPESPMRNVRFILLLENLKRSGAVFKSDPPEEALEGETDTSTLRFIYYGDLTHKELFQICRVDMVEDIQIENHPQAMAAAEPAVGAAATAASTVEESRLQTRNIKVSADKIDYLMNNVGELVIINSGLQKVYDDLFTDLGDSNLLTELKGRIDGAARIARDLQAGIMKTRMIPVGLVFHRFTRPVRDLSQELGKEVDLVFQGEDTELDKNIIDALTEPLLHLLRNSIDHGIEMPDDRTKAGKSSRASLVLNAYQGGNNIFIEIRDDGRGLNREKILERARSQELLMGTDPDSDDEIFELIFQPGFSTAETVSDISGRGVGMNVVKSMIQKFNGSIRVQSEDGKGASFVLSFPLTLAIISAILVQISGEEYAFPLSDVVENIKITREDITTLEGRDIFNLRGEILPIYGLGKLMGLPADDVTQEFPVVIVNSGNRKIGFIVDDLVGKKEIVIKTLDQNFRMVKGLIGATLMGDGRIVMVLDVQGLLELAGRDERDPSMAGFVDSLQSLEAVTSYNLQVEEMNRVARTTERNRPTRERLAEKGEGSGERDLPEASTAIAPPPSREPAAPAGETASAGALPPGGGGDSGSGSTGQELADLIFSDGDAPVAPPTPETASAPNASPAMPGADEPDPASVLFSDQSDASGLLVESSVADKPVETSESPSTTPETASETSAGDAPASGDALVDELHDSYASGDPDAVDVPTAPDADDRVAEVLASMRADKEERRDRARELAAAEQAPREISQEEYDRLYSVVNTGMTGAGMVLSQLLGVTVEVSVPELKVVAPGELSGYMPADKIVGVRLDTEGDHEYVLLLVFDETTGYRAAGDLMGLPREDWVPDKISTEDLESVLAELTNIVGSSILNAIANKIGANVMPSPPSFLRGSVEQMMDQFKPTRSGDEPYQIIYISADFFREDMELLGRLFLFVPRSSLDDLINRL